MSAFDVRKVTKPAKFLQGVFDVDAYRQYLTKFSGKPGLLRPFWRTRYDMRRAGLTPVLAFAETIDYYEPAKHFLGQGDLFFPSDYWEFFEKWRAQEYQVKRGDKLWGLEIGIRFFPTKEHYPPLACNGLVKMFEQVYQHRFRDKEYNSLSLAQKLEIILIGGPEEYLRNVKWARKFWVFQTYEEFRSIALFDEFSPTLENLYTFWETEERKYLSRLLSDFLLQDQAVTFRLKRLHKWHMLESVRVLQVESKFGWFRRIHVFLRFLVDFKLGRYKVKK